MCVLTAKKTVGKWNSRTRVLIGSSSFTLNCNSNCSSAPATENWLHQFKCELFNFTTNEQEEEEGFAIEKQTPSAPLAYVTLTTYHTSKTPVTSVLAGWLRCCHCHLSVKLVSLRWELAVAARQSDYWANYHDTRFSCLAGLLLIPVNGGGEKTAVDAIKKRDLLNWNIGEFQLIESATEGIIL